jgi:hypothetical protein
MGMLEDILSGAQGAVESGARWLDDNTALGSHRRNTETLSEIDRIAAEQGYPSAMHPEFQRKNPDLAEAYNTAAQSLTQIATPTAVTGAVGPMGAAARAARAVPNTTPSPTPPPPVAPAARSVAPPPPPSPGLLTTLGNLPGRTKALLGAGALGAGATAGAITAAATAGRSSPPDIQSPDMYGPGTKVTEDAWTAERKREEGQRAQATRDRQVRGDEADIGLTEAQAAYYRAQREKALRELANDDLSDSEKEEIAHEYAMEQIEARAKHERETAMIREGGENERTATREAGENRRTQYTGEVSMRGQDQQARQAQDSFVTNWFTNQIQNGQLSLERATKLFEAYQKQRALPAEILDKVSQATARMEQYRTTVNDGQAPPGFEKGGVMAGLSKMAGIKFDPKAYIAQKPHDSWMETARQYGAVPNNSPMPTVDQIYQGAGQGADMSPESVERIRGASASGTMLPRPDMGMPDDIQQRIMAGLR